MAQSHTTTSTNRYPGIFRTVQARLRDRLGPTLNGGHLRILSFGCSDGTELQTLQCYFPEATLFGCDVNQVALAAARDKFRVGEVVLYQSSAHNIEEFGPYDVVFCMSVLCHYPLSRRNKSINSEFTFAEFQDHLSIILSNLTHDGIICVYNSNYSFSMFKYSKYFVKVRSPLIYSNGFVNKFSPLGERITTNVGTGPGYYHVIVGNTSSISDDDFVDCIFERHCDNRPDEDIVWVGFLDENGPSQAQTIAERHRFGIDMTKASANGWIAANMSCWLMQVYDQIWIKREWSRSTLSGTVRNIGPWWARGSYEQLEEFSPRQSSILSELSRSSARRKYLSSLVQRVPLLRRYVRA